jgi:hypothetical protein
MNFGVFQESTFKNLNYWNFRLDFNNFVTQLNPASAGACLDSFLVTSPTGPITTNICGTNTNQHSKL